MSPVVAIVAELQAARRPLKKDGGQLDTGTRRALTELEALMSWADDVAIWPDVWLPRAEPVLAALERGLQDEALNDEDRSRFMVCAWRLRRAIEHVRVVAGE